LSIGHARAILSLPNDDLRRKLANLTLAGRLSVREVERQVKLMLSKEKATDLIKKTKAPHIVDLEGKLTSQIGSKVKINTRKNGQRGKLVIEFNSLDEFDRILDRLGISSINEL
jgi:ParB family chromosome partitioning protein